MSELRKRTDGSLGKMPNQATQKETMSKPKPFEKQEIS